MKLMIDAQSVTKPMTFAGETIIINLHGALISTAVRLIVGMKFEIHVYLTGKHAKAEVVRVDPEQPLLCGIALEVPRNIWGVSLPPHDWREGALQ